MCYAKHVAQSSSASPKHDGGRVAAAVIIIAVIIGVVVIVYRRRQGKGSTSSVTHSNAAYESLGHTAEDAVGDAEDDEDLLMASVDEMTVYDDPDTFNSTA